MELKFANKQTTSILLTLVVALAHCLFALVWMEGGVFEIVKDTDFLK